MKVKKTNIILFVLSLILFTCGFLIIFLVGGFLAIVFGLVLVFVAIGCFGASFKESNNKKIIKTQIIGNDSTKSASSSIVRGAIGGALFGNLGMIGGAMSGKNKNRTTFLLIYNDGTRETMTVKDDSTLYNTFIQLLEV